jgi:hypothetical protein
MEMPLSYKLTVTQKPAYLHAIVTGMNSKENVAGYLEEIQRECTARNCFRVLIEERLEGPRLSTMGVFQIASDASSRVQQPFEAIAYVDVNAEGNLMDFAETVAVNRGLPVRVFSSVSEAEKWLQGKGSMRFPKIHSSGHK